MPIEYDFGILKEHYEKHIKFVPRKRYTFMTPFMAFNYQDGFVAEYEFRRELLNKRPIFVANAPPEDEIVIDVDYRINEFKEENFDGLRTIAKLVITSVEEIIPFSEYYFRFSGRGVHVVIKTDILKRVEYFRLELGIPAVKDARSLLMKYIVEGLKRSFNWPTLKEYIDPQNLASNKIYRTPGSINDKTFLPVADFRPNEKITIDKIINYYTKPRTFFVKFSKPVKIRNGEEFITSKFAYVDEYELLRQIITNNYYIESVTEV